MAQNGEYRVSRAGVRRIYTCARAHVWLSFVRGPRGYGIVSACFAVWDQDPKVRLDRDRHKNSGGQRGQQRSLVFPGPLLSCDMLLVRYDSGVRYTSFLFCQWQCSRCLCALAPCETFLSLLSSSSIFFLPPSLEISSQYVISLDENREIRITGIGSYVCNRYVPLGRQKDEFFLWHGRVSVWSILLRQDSWNNEPDD